MTLEKKQKFNLNIPGKTFLVGEYAVLSGGECLGLGTDPFFQMQAVASHGQVFHPDSPAGLYLLKNSIEPFKFNFTNPYEVGGFGASTAEFIFSYSYVNDLGQQHSLQKILNEYLELFKNNPMQKPSGADLVTQLMGGISHFQNLNGVIQHQAKTWNFKNLDFLIFSTGLKIKTHEHLAELDRKKCDTLIEPSHQVIKAFSTSDEQIFTEELRTWSEKLKQLQLTSDLVLNLKQYLESKIENIFVKPCGALGADVVLVLCPTEAKNAIRKGIESLQVQGLKYRADSSSLALGPLA